MKRMKKRDIVKEIEEAGKNPEFIRIIEKYITKKR